MGKYMFYIRIVLKRCHDLNKKYLQYGRKILILS